MALDGNSTISLNLYKARGRSLPNFSDSLEYVSSQAVESTPYGSRIATAGVVDIEEGDNQQTGISVRRVGFSKKNTAQIIQDREIYVTMNSLHGIGEC
jgi:hypothetical protein